MILTHDNSDMGKLWQTQNSRLISLPDGWAVFVFHEFCGEKWLWNIECLVLRMYYNEIFWESPCLALTLFMENPPIQLVSLFIEPKMKDIKEFESAKN